MTGVTSVLGVGPLNATTNVGRLTVTLRSRDVRSVSADAIADRLKAAGEKLAGATLFIEPVQDIQITTRPSRSQYQYTLTSADAGDLLHWSDRLLDQLRASRGCSNVAAETQDGGLRGLVRIDRDKMGRLGISAQNVDDMLNDAFGQRQISTIYTQSNQYRVILEAAPQYLRDPSALEKLYVAPVGGGPQTPLGDLRAVSSRSPRRCPSRIRISFPRRRSASISSNGVALGDAVKMIARAEKRDRHAGDRSPASSAPTRRNSTNRWRASPGSSSRRSSRSMSCSAFSTRASRIPSPFSPPCRRRASARCWRCCCSARHVDRRADRHRAADGHREEERDHDDRLRARRRTRSRACRREESIVRAAQLRFRPIMMTTLAALFGALPLALAHGAGKRIAHPAGHFDHRRPAASARR